MCWPVERPSFLAGGGRVKVYSWVSDERRFLVIRVAWVHLQELAISGFGLDEGCAGGDVLVFV